MNIRQFVQGLLKQETSTPRFKAIPDSEGLNLVLPDNIFQQCQVGAPLLDDALQYQFITLKMLAEQGEADLLPNGFFLTSDNAVRLTEDNRLLLQLPQSWHGKFQVDFEGKTTQPAFACQLSLIEPGGEYISQSQIIFRGPLIKLTETEQYLPSPEQWHLLKAVLQHQALAPGLRGEYHNLLAVFQMQQALAEGCQVDLGHFRNIEAVSPEGIGVDVQIDSDGSAVITPTVGNGVDTNDLSVRLGQLDNEGKVQSLRIGKRIVLLDETRIEAIQEILKSRRIPREQVKRFLETPSAFLDAALVNLDQGFSLRVRGATEFQHAYFGEVEISGVDWFTQQLTDTQQAKPLADLCKTLETPEQVDELEQRICDAENSGSSSISVECESYDIRDSQRNKNLLTATRNRISSTQSYHTEQEQAPNESKPVQLVVDVAENDEELEFGDARIPQLIQEVSYKGDIDYSPLKRQPYPHQDEGIRWLLGLAEPSINDSGEDTSLHGGLLADDMGLGKTFMALVGVSEYYRLCREQQVTERPVLVVAPLSLLENWRDEINDTFTRSPFSDVVILQSNADLKTFRLKGSGSELKQHAGAKIDTQEHSEDSEWVGIRYSLKVGAEYGLDRLDKPRRIVLTTYQTLRDYQFSLCRVDWSVVIFDEAQAIKSPNTLATRAAKGLKARFRLLATGTPIENHLGDFWCLMDTVKPGALGAYQAFRQTYMVPISKAQPENTRTIKEELGMKLRYQVGALMLRRLKEDNLKGLPEKRQWVGVEALADGVHCFNPTIAGVMTSGQLQNYDKVVAEVIDARAMDNAQGIVLPAMLKLREISIHQALTERTLPELSTGERGIREFLSLSAKTTALLSILDDIRQRQQKTIIFAMNKRLQTLLKLALMRIYRIHIEIINGDTKAVSSGKSGGDETRKGLIRKFESEPGFGVIIMSPIAAGAGLTVVGANNVIHLERHWNPAKEAQATDRVYRIGQTLQVNVYLPMALHPDTSSFDTNLHGLLCNKTTLKDAVVTPEAVSPEMLAGCLSK